MRAMKDSGIEWIGEIPQNWLTKKLKYCVDLRLEKTADKASSASYIGLEHVSSFTGTLCEDYEAITDFNGDTLDFYEGDVLFGKLRPYLAKAYQAKDNGRCSSEFWVMNPIGIEARYLLYYVLSHGFISDIDHSTFGVKMPRAEWDYAGNEKLPIPSQEEQFRIASFLDTKCAEIDALIAAKEKTNALLKERRQSIIYEAVTKGLDPTVPMKDSGVDWIGEIPEGWNVCRIKTLFEIIGGNGFKEHLQGNESGDYPFYKVSDINGDSIHSGRAANYISSLTVEEYAFNLIPSKSIIMSKIGEALKKNHRKISSTNCCIDNNLQALVPINDIDEVYYYYVLRCVNMEWFDNGGTIPSVNNQRLRDLKLPLPPSLEEQFRIASFLNTKCAEIDALIAANEETVKKLKEYRQSLLYEAVTGKIEA